MNSLFYSTLHPEIYHGKGRSPPFFEGWYFKIVDAEARTAWAIIPGIYKGKNSTKDEAFIMILDGRTHKSTFHSFPVEEFRSDDDRVFAISIQNNSFSCEGLSINLPELSGSIRFENVVPWPVSLMSPGIMGPFAYLPLECYHGVLSMDHTVYGELETPTGRIDFNGGRGYIEKDWGSNFPQTWIWMQANHFEEHVGTSISLSIARLPLYGLVFPGFIIGLWHQNILHRFTTYVSAQLQKVKVDENKVSVVVRNRTHRLCVTSNRAPTACLHMPTVDEGMVARVDESVGASISVQLYEIKNHNNEEDDDVLLFDGKSRHGALEVFGDISILLCGEEESHGGRS